MLLLLLVANLPSDKLPEQLVQLPQLAPQIPAPALAPTPTSDAAECLNGSPGRQELRQQQQEAHAPFNLMRQSGPRDTAGAPNGSHLQLMLRDSDNLTMPHRQRHKKKRKVTEKNAKRTFSCGIFNLKFLSFRQVFWQPTKFGSRLPQPRFEFGI